MKDKQARTVKNRIITRTNNQQSLP